MFFNVNITFK